MIQMISVDFNLIGYVELAKDVIPDWNPERTYSFEVTHEDRVYVFAGVKPAHIGDEHVAFAFTKDNLVDMRPVETDFDNQL